MKYRVYFENRYYERIFICECEEEEIFKKIHSDLTTRAQSSFKSYYTRTWTRDNGEKVYDVGSHVEEYVAVPLS